MGSKRPVHPSDEVRSVESEGKGVDEGGVGGVS